MSLSLYGRIIPFMDEAGGVDKAIEAGNTLAREKAISSIKHADNLVATYGKNLNTPNKKTKKTTMDEAKKKEKDAQDGLDKIEAKKASGEPLSKADMEKESQLKNQLTSAKAMQGALKEKGALTLAGVSQIIDQSKIDSMQGQSLGIRANMKGDKNSSIYTENAMYGEMSKQQATKAKIDAQGGVATAVSSDVAESAVKAAQQQAGTQAQISQLLQSDAGGGKKTDEANALSKGIVDGTIKGGEVLKNALAGAASLMAAQVGGKTKSDIKNVDGFNTTQDYIDAQGDMGSYKAGQSKAQVKALHTKNSDGTSVLNDEGNVTEQGQEMLTRSEQHKTAEQLKRSGNYSNKKLMQGGFAQMINSKDTPEERIKAAQTMKSMGFIEEVPMFSRNGKVDPKNIKPANAQSIARAMGEAEGNRINDKMGGIILDDGSQEFSWAGTGVSSTNNKSHTKSDGKSRDTKTTKTQQKVAEDRAKDTNGNGKKDPDEVQAYKEIQEAAQVSTDPSFWSSNIMANLSQSVGFGGNGAIAGTVLTVGTGAAVWANHKSRGPEKLSKEAIDTKVSSGELTHSVDGDGKPNGFRDKSGVKVLNANGEKLKPAKFSSKEINNLTPMHDSEGIVNGYADSDGTKVANADGQKLKEDGKVVKSGKATKGAMATWGGLKTGAWKTRDALEGLFSDSKKTSDSTKNPSQNEYGTDDKEPSKGSSNDKVQKRPPILDTTSVSKKPGTSKFISDGVGGTKPNPDYVKPSGSTTKEPKSFMGEVMDGFKNSSLLKHKVGTALSVAAPVVAVAGTAYGLSGTDAEASTIKPLVSGATPPPKASTSNDGFSVQNMVSAGLDTAAVGFNAFTGYMGMNEMKDGVKANALMKDATMGVKAAGGLGKFALKKLPLIGLGLGMSAAYRRAQDGDYTGAGLEALSGIASMAPGLGTMASAAIDTGLIARDRFSSSVPQHAQNAFQSQSEANTGVAIQKDFNSGKAVPIAESSAVAQPTKAVPFAESPTVAQPTKADTKADTKTDITAPQDSTVAQPSKAVPFAESPTVAQPTKTDITAPQESTVAQPSKAVPFAESSAVTQPSKTDITAPQESTVAQPTKAVPFAESSTVAQPTKTDITAPQESTVAQPTKAVPFAESPVVAQQSGPIAMPATPTIAPILATIDTSAISTSLANTLSTLSSSSIVGTGAQAAESQSGKMINSINNDSVGVSSSYQKISQA